METVVYFDLKTQKAAEEVDGWGNIHDMKMSVGVTYSTTRDSYLIYAEDDVNDLMEELRRADLVVGFSILHSRFPRTSWEKLRGALENTASDKHLAAVRQLA